MLLTSINDRTIFGIPRRPVPPASTAIPQAQCSLLFLFPKLLHMCAALVTQGTHAFNCNKQSYKFWYSADTCLISINASHPEGAPAAAGHMLITCWSRDCFKSWQRKLKKLPVKSYWQEKQFTTKFIFSSSQPILIFFTNYFLRFIEGALVYHSLKLKFLIYVLWRRRRVRPWGANFAN